jgi:hypothetical protein
MSTKRLIAALDVWLRDELDKVEEIIGRECRDRDMPPIWHRVRRLRDEMEAMDL